MHLTADVQQTFTAKPEIIRYYKTKGGVDTMDKMLEECTVKCRTNRWPLAFFNMIDIAAFSPYIMCVNHDQGFKSTDRRRRFLKDLANQLCIPAIQFRTFIPKVVGNHYAYNSMEIILGSLIQQVVAVPKDLPTRDSSGRIQVFRCCRYVENWITNNGKVKKLFLLAQRQFAMNTQ